MKIKFLFINAVNPHKEIETVYPPLGIGYLISSLRKKFGTEVCEFKVVNDNIEAEIDTFKPDIVGISSTTQNYCRAMSYAETAKERGILVMCGGIHVSMLPSSLTRNMDVGVIGEGEETICELFELFLANRSLPKNELQNVKGIIYWDDKGEIKATEKRGLIAQLDCLDLPARDVLDVQESTYMFTSRGCPYPCTFCASTRFWDKVRLFSAEYVVREIELLVNSYGVKTISFYDDIFSIDVKRVRKIYDMLEAKGIIGKVKFTCSIRSNLVNDETMALLKKLGVDTISMGLESGSNEILKFLKKESIDISDNERGVQIIKKHKIRVLVGSFIIGSPMETREDVLKTLKFVKKSRLDDFGLYVLTPFPGTPIWEYAKERGLVSDNMDWNKLNVCFEDVHEEAIVLSEKLSKDELWELFLKFEAYKKRRKIYVLFERAVRNPVKIPRFFFRKISALWGQQARRVPA